ncbi:MAG: SDR family oxidoreductase [Rhizobiaceae bacterium]|nr:SDR family oxidoreductase [Rhizobiaceae bacterium]
MNSKAPAIRQRSILVTGASSGIGAWCARALSTDGWRVFATARKPDDIAALRTVGIEAFYLDYTKPASIGKLVTDIMELTGGRLDALYNNGAYAQAGAVEDVPVDALRHQFEANLFGWHDLTRRVIPAMRAQGHGRIVNCSSILGLVPARFRGPYAASKHALEALTLCMRMELKGSGIHVSLIEPGPVESKIAANGLPWFERYIDWDKSAHRDAYLPQLERLRSGGAKSRLKRKPEAVYRMLKHALESPRPRPHYIVTIPAIIGVTLKRLLPASMFYYVMSRQG